MKRKIFCILFASVLVLSFSLVTAVPAATVGPGLLPEVAFQTTGTSAVDWSTVEKKFGDWSVLLSLAAPTDEARVAVVIPDTPDFDALAGLAYWYYIKTAAADTVPDAALKDSTEPDFTDFTPVPGYAAPYAVIELDKNDDGAPDVWVVEARYADDSMGAWEQRSMGTSDYFHAAGAGVPTELVLPNIATLATIKADAFFDGAKVLKVKVMMGSWGAYITDSPEAYVDDVDVDFGGTTYALEPRVINTTQTKGYNAIQYAVDDANPAGGDTINVAAGTYNENVNVNKSVTLIGAGAGSTIVQAADPNVHVFHVTSNNVTIDGFTVQGATGSNMAGIRIGCCDGGRFENNTVRGNVFGIDIFNSSNVTAATNEVYNNLAEGIYLQSDCTNCIIDDNIVHDNDVIHAGILLHYCSGIQVSNNEVYNEAFGILLQASDDNTILNNSIHDNGHGICIASGSVATSDNNKILGNSIVNNNQTVDSGIHLTSGASGTIIHFNNIVGNSPEGSGYGVYNGNTSETVDATNNWWGASDGPSTSPGSGDKVSDHVAYGPWLGAPLELPAAYHETLGPGEHEVDATDEADTKVTLTVTAEASETDIYIARYESQPFPEEPFPDASLGKFIDIYLSNPDAVDWPIYVEVSYTDDEVGGAGVKEPSLGLYYYMSPDTFHRCSDTGVDTRNNIIWANVTEEEGSYLAWTPFGGGGSPPTVGGTVLPVDKVSILMPWIGLAVALALAGVFIARFARRRARG